MPLNHSGSLCRTSTQKPMWETWVTAQKYKTARWLKSSTEYLTQLTKVNPALICQLKSYVKLSQNSSKCFKVISLSESWRPIGSLMPPLRRRCSNRITAYQSEKMCAELQAKKLSLSCAHGLQVCSWLRKKIQGSCVSATNFRILIGG